MTHRQEVNKCWKNSANRLAQHTADIHFQIVKHTIPEKHN